MAKYETQLTGSFDQTLAFLEQRIQNSADSMNLVDLSDFSLGETKIAVRVYDKYFMRNGSRASLTLTLAGTGDKLYLCAIGAGGGNGIVFNFSLGAESALVAVVEKAVESLRQESM